MKLKELKKGDLFLRGPETKETIFPPPHSMSVWVKGEYDREMKAYNVYRYNDFNHDAYMSGDKEVNTNFVF